MSYHIIGDIHGHADQLTALLQKLSYQHRGGAWRHPSRSAIFVGDFVDRRPGQLRTLELVREMIEAGSARAVMGYHEFRAIAWAILTLRKKVSPPTAEQVIACDVATGAGLS